MGNLVIATPRISDAATITGAATASGMTVANLLKPQPTDRCRFAGLGSMHVVLDLGSAQAINLIWAGYGNWSSGALWRIRAAATEADLTAAPAQDTTLVSMWPGAFPEAWSRRHALKWLGDSPWTYRWWRLDFDDASNPDGYGQFGRLYLASAYQPPLNMQYGARYFFVESSRRRESEGGQIHARRRTRRQAAELTIKTKTQADAFGQVYEINRLRGVSEDVLLVGDPEATDYLMHQTVYGLLSDLGGVQLQSYAYYAHTFRFEELP